MGNSSLKDDVLKELSKEATDRTVSKYWDITRGWNGNEFLAYLLKKCLLEIKALCVNLGESYCDVVG